MTQNRPRKNEIQLAPTMYHQAEALMHLLARYDWYKFSVIISDNSGWNEFLRSLEYFETSLGIKQYFINLLNMINTLSLLMIDQVSDTVGGQVKAEKEQNLRQTRGHIEAQTPSH